MYYFFLFLNQLPLEELGTAILDLAVKSDFINLIQLLVVLIKCVVQLRYTYFKQKLEKKNKDALLASL